MRENKQGLEWVQILELGQVVLSLEHTKESYKELELLAKCMVPMWEGQVERMQEL